MSLTIGVFDSGFGGLTVLRAMLPLLGGTDCIYLGDTARLPYGSKSHETIARYAVSAAEFLLEQGAEFLVIACNTASALALEEIRAAASVPVLGVIETGAAAAAEVSRSKSVLVLCTAATVASHAYARTLESLGLRATEMACPLLVPLVEEGWVEHRVTDEVVSTYLRQAMAAAKVSGEKTPDTILLGCTHYPLLRHVFAKHMPQRMHIVDSAASTAARAAMLLKNMPAAFQPADSTSNDCVISGSLQFYVTDSPERFQQLGGMFLGQPVRDVTLVELPE